MSEGAPLSPDRWELEFVLKERDLHLRERQSRLRHSPLFLGLLAAAIALAGNILVTQYQARTAERQTHLKAQSDLILEAIKTGDQNRAGKNLLFLIRLGLLDDPDGKMKAALSHPDDVPVLPASPVHLGYGQGGYGVVPYGGQNPASPQAKPIISSTPPIFAEEGEIKGKNFGSKRGQIYRHVRVKPSAQQGPYADGGIVDPDRLLGSMDPQNMDDVTSDVLAWTDTSIRIKLPKGYWQDFKSHMIDIAQARQLSAPSPGDLQVGFVVIPAGVEWNPPQFHNFFYSDH